MDAKTTGKIVMIGLMITIMIGLYIIIIPLVSGKTQDVSANKGASLQKWMPGQVQTYPKDSIAVMNIFSPISYYYEDEYFGIKRGGALYWIELLQSIEDNPNVKALIIRMNSPGGTVAATQEIYNEIKRLKKKGKIVTVSMGDIAASGGYYISCAADRIIANPGTLTGSIGVIMSGVDLSDLLKKIGVSFNVIKSGKNKDIMSMYRKMTPDETKLLESVVMDSYDQFLTAVSEGRKIDKEKLREIADGSIFTGRQALRNKLVDELGDFEQAVDATAKLAGIKGKPNVMDLKPEGSGMFRLLTSSFGGLLQGKKGINLVESPAQKISGNYSPVLYMYEY